MDFLRANHFGNDMRLHTGSCWLPEEDRKFDQRWITCNEVSHRRILDEDDEGCSTDFNWTFQRSFFHCDFQSFCEKKHTSAFAQDKNSSSSGLTFIENHLEVGQIQLLVLCCAVALESWEKRGETYESRWNLSPQWFGSFLPPLHQQCDEQHAWANATFENSRGKILGQTWWGTWGCAASIGELNSSS